MAFYGAEAADDMMQGGLAQQLLATNPGPMASAPEAASGDRGCWGLGAAGSETPVGLKGGKGKGKTKAVGKASGGGGDMQQEKKRTILVCTHVELYMHHAVIPLLREFHLRPDLMPDPNVDPKESAEWLLPKLIANLGDAKLWPVRLATVRHSDALGLLASSFTFSESCRCVFQVHRSYSF